MNDEEKWRSKLQEKLIQMVNIFFTNPIENQHVRRDRNKREIFIVSTNFFFVEKLFRRFKEFHRVFSISTLTKDVAASSFFVFQGFVDVTLVDVSD